MKRTLATAGLPANAAASRLYAGCVVADQPWHADVATHVINRTSIDMFTTSKATRRLKEPSP